MSASRAETVELLETWAERLRAQADSEHEATVDAHDQLVVENTIAAGIAILAGEDAPEPAVEESGRSIMAKDLFITVDLVVRALQAQP